MLAVVRDPSDLPDAQSLANVLRRLGPEIVTVKVAPGGLNVAVRSVTIAEQDTAPGPGELIAAVNVDPASRYFRELMGAAGRAGCAAVVIKDSLDELVDTDEVADFGVALLVLGPGVGWHRFVALATTASARGGNDDRWGGAPLGDLFSLAEATAAAVGGAIAIMDRQRRVLAYSSLEGQPTDQVRRDGILGRRVPDEYVAAHLDQRVWRTRRPQIVESPGALPRLAIAVTAGNEALGSIWAIIPEPTTTPAQESALGAAADIAALHLLKVASVSSVVTWRVRETEIRAELLGASGAAPPEHPSIVLAAAIRTDGSVTDALTEQVAGLLAVLTGHFPHSGCAIIDDTVYALLQAPTSQTLQDAKAIASKAVERCANAFGNDLRVAIGGPSELAYQAREQAEQTLSVLRHGGGPGVATFEQARTDIAIRHLHEVLADDPIHLPEVDRMLQHDRERGTTFARTVLTYLEHSGNIAGAATDLYVHPNTFRYRISRAQELFAIGLEKPDARLLTWLKLRIQREVDR